MGLGHCLPGKPMDTEEANGTQARREGCISLLRAK